MIKAYKYCIKPNDEQKVLIEKHFGCCRFVYNYGLDKKIKAYELDKSRVSCFDLINDFVDTQSKGATGPAADVLSGLKTEDELLA